MLVRLLGRAYPPTHGDLRIHSRTKTEGAVLQSVTDELRLSMPGRGLEFGRTCRGCFLGGAATGTGAMVFPQVDARLSRRALLRLTDWRRCGMREAFGTGMRLPLITHHTQQQ